MKEERCLEEAGSELRIAGRFCGPPGTGNGRFASGSLTARLAGTIHLGWTLRRPVPLGVGGTPWTPDPPVGGPEGEVVAAARSLWIIVRKHTGGPP